MGTKIDLRGKFEDSQENSEIISTKEVTSLTKHKFLQGFEQAGKIEAAAYMEVSGKF